MKERVRKALKAMKLAVPELLYTHPTVFAVGKDYQIMVPVKRDTLMSVKCGDEEYFDDSNGIMRSKCMIHRFNLPQAVLDEAKEYTLCCRPIIDRKPYFPETEDLQTFTYAFCPLEKTQDIRIAHLSDTHGLVEPPVARALLDGKPDILLLNGDIADHSGNEENMLVLFRLASAVAEGGVPCVFSRGNHDLRGALAERLEQYTPNANGNSYYTFRIGCVWGVVLDCGEDKVDEHEEYGHTVCCHAFRKRETAFLEQVIADAAQEYAADGVKYRLVVSHVPFTRHNRPPFDIEFDIFDRWVSLLREHVKPQLMLCGHVHKNVLYLPLGENDAHGQQWPVVVASVPKKDEAYFSGAHITLNADSATVEIKDNADNLLDTWVLKL
ncbi:MAG: metallophosphoesterase [Clostridia bacterium]|nr:metallophosphoesterase [Clostridia bacterium]